jgi:SAM-dependent methyltransferase
MTTTVPERRGMHRILDLSWAYSIFQGGIGKPDSADRLRERFYPELGSSFTRVLDMGCGPAAFLASNAGADGVHAAGFDYVGFDPNPKYIATAREQFRDAELHVGTTATVGSVITGPFDLVVAIGVLHHVDDAIVRDLASFAATRLRPGGRFVTMDPTVLDGQRMVARLLARSDRGRYVRSPSSYADLVGEAFSDGEVQTFTLHDLLRVPYDHCVTVSTLEPVPDHEDPEG